MKIPDTGRRKALIVVDLQPAFLNEQNEYIVHNVKQLIDRVAYDAYVEAVFSAEKGSLWDIQQLWICPEDENTRTAPEAADALRGKKPLQVHKHTRSVFSGNQDVAAYLKKHRIEEVHIVGTETNECVLATTFDAFDSGFIPYVLEECCEAATTARHQMGIDILRIQGMCNNRCVANTIDVEI